MASSLHSRPSSAKHGSNERYTSQGSINTEIYGPGLRKFCGKNTSDLKISQLQVKTDKFQKDLQVRIVKDQFENPLPSEVDSDESRSEVWHSRKLNTQYNGALDNAKRDYFLYEDSELPSENQKIKKKNKSKPKEPSKKEMAAPLEELSAHTHIDKGYCYLCSMKTELVKREKKQNGKPLKPYANPIDPFTLPKQIPEIETQDPDGDRAIYKISVKTGSELGCGTNAQVSLQLYGEQRKEKSRIISLKKPNVNFRFVRGAVDKFSITSVHIPNITNIKVQTDGAEVSQSWFLDWIEITNMKNKKVYYFPCFNWISLFHEGKTLERILTPQERETIVRAYEVVISTGTLVHSGIDSKVYLTLVGATGKRSKRVLLNKEQRAFKRGGLDKFNVKSPDIGKLSKIRIEHDNRGKSRRWLLNFVHITDQHDSSQHLFYCNQWLIDEEGNAPWREVGSSRVPADFPLSNLGVQDQDGEVLYEIVVKTGNKALAGTDSQVFVQFYGDKSTSPVQVLSNMTGNYQDPFERGQDDTFQFKTQNVGVIKKLRIGHDNSGVAPGWYCEHVVLRKFFDVREIKPVEQTPKNFRRLTDINSDSEHDSSVSSQSESSDTESKKKKKAKGRRSTPESEIHSLTSQLLGRQLSADLDSDDSSLDSDERLDRKKKKSKSASVMISRNSVGNEKTDKPEKSRKSSRDGRRKTSADAKRRETNLDSDTNDESDATSVWDSDELVMREKIGFNKKTSQQSFEEKVVSKVEEYKFVCNDWFSTGDGDGLTERKYYVTEEKTYNRR